ncbi:MAG: hypothetical protein AB7I06_11465 [Burkholderiales bacterium]
MGQEPRVRGSALRALSRAALLLPVLLGMVSPGEAQVRLAQGRNANGTAPSAPAYEDRVIEGLAPAEEVVEEREYQRAGWPRFLRLETRLGTQPFDERKVEAGFTAAGAIDTPNHGVVSLDASFAPEQGRNAVTLRQRGLPMDGGWLVNNEIGIGTPLAPGIMRLPSRVYVPSILVRGASTEWVNAGSQAQFMASSGEYGRLQGYPISGFLPLAGDISTVAAQGRAGGWNLALRHAHAEGVSQFESPSKPSDFVSSESTHVAARREWGANSLQGNVIATRTGTEARTRHGAWIDGEWKRGTSAYGAGVFRLDPNLSWAGQSMASDIEGAYLRGAWHTRQWTAQGSVDLLHAISGSDDVGVLANASGQWRYSRRLSWGAGGTVRRFNGNAGSAFADVRWQHDWGSSGLRADLTSSGNDERTRRLTFDHEWQMPLDWTLTTSVLGGRESFSGGSRGLWGAALSITAPLTAYATLTGNANTEHRDDGNSTTGANVSLVWRLSRNWALEGNFFHSRGRRSQLAPLDPLAPLPERLTFADDTRSFFLLLRYEERAGSRSLPLGGTPVGGGGSIEGVVFLDANRNGRKEAGEGGAAGATVYLDGRYATRTDAQGRFEFPFVAVGPRVITVLNETLPLPWEIGDRAETRVEVIVREATRVTIPVVRRGPE